MGGDFRHYNSMTAKLAYKTNALLGEGAIWNSNSKTLYWVDIEGCTFNCYNPDLNVNRVYNTGKRAGTVVPVDDQNVLIAVEDGLALLNLINGRISYKLKTDIHLEGKRFNDGKCDPQGRFWVGSLTTENATGDNKLYSVGSDLKLIEKLSNLTISNGIGWSADSSRMYHIDTPTAEISQYDFDKATGKISNKKVIIKVNPTDGYPDGMTVDSEDMLWVALWDGFGVVRYNPTTGHLLQKIEVPAPKVTSCTFGGEDLDQLFITTATCEMTNEELEQYPLSGSLFVADVGIKGCKSNILNATPFSTKLTAL